MKTLLFLLFFLISHFLSAQNIERVRSYLDTLCSPNMHGRGYVKNGDKIAAEYLEQKFREIGLAHYGNNNTHPYFQNYNLNINTFPDTVILKADKKTLTTGKDYILHPASASGNKHLKVFRLDTNIFTNKKSLKKFLDLKTNNLCLVIKSSQRKKIETLSEEVQDKFSNAGCIIELQEKKLTASLADFQYNQPRFEILDSLFPKSTKKVFFHVNAKLIKNYPSQNVIGYIQGNKNSDSIVIISAHYDHLGRMGNNTFFPGANDNGSGISMLLELARHYKENPPAHTIVFITFGSEEAGLIGSRFFVEHPLFPLTKIRFLINLDLEGTGDEGITVVNATLFPDDFSKLDSINIKQHYLPLIKKRGAAANSDHYFFSNKGVPAFFIYTMGGITAYHDIYDRAETLPLTKFKEVFLLLVEFINKL